jgi:hypothetical protein
VRRRYACSIPALVQVLLSVRRRDHVIHHPPAFSPLFSDRERLFFIQQPAPRKDVSLREDFQRVWEAMVEVSKVPRPANGCRITV